MQDIDVNNWEITTNRFVGFIDIMGFKDMVARSSHEEIYVMMKKINDFQKFSTSIKWNINEENPQLVKTTTYSDSIMVYSLDGSNESLNSFICTISALIHDLFAEGIPFKGSIAYGMMTIDMERSIFFGQPLIDSYLLQEEMKFYGIIVHGTAQRIIENSTGIPFYIPYLCPLKNGNSVHLTIAPIYWTVKGYEDRNRKLTNSLRKMRYKTSGSIRKYIDLTEEYLEIIKVKS